MSESQDLNEGTLGREVFNHYQICNKVNDCPLSTQMIVSPFQFY